MLRLVVDAVEELRLWTPALEELCPDLVGMDVEGLPDPEEEALSGMPPAMASQTRAWFDVEGIGELQPDALAAANMAACAW